jgi:hypothetical protein
MYIYQPTTQGEVLHVLTFHLWSRLKAPGTHQTINASSDHQPRQMTKVDPG